MRHFFCLAALAAAVSCAQPADVLHLATTTSVENSGLLPAILPEFQRASGIEVRSLAVGSGRALDILERGDADLALTHDPEAERRLLDRGLLAEYRKVMFNDFVIAGPALDPAGVHQAGSTADAMARIAAGTTSFASRADSSGTHTKELGLWRDAGRTPEGPRLLETGQGMAATLRIASERQAYVLTDRSTFRQIEPTLRLTLLFENDPPLLNPYAVMYAKRISGARLDEAKQFVSWLTDGPGREAIARYQIKGQPAFTVWPTGVSRSQPGDLPDVR